MAESIRERLLQAVHAALSAISRENGYALDLASVERTRTTPMALDSGAFPCVFIYEGQQTVSDGPLPLRTKRLQVVLQAWVKSADNDLSVAVNTLAAAIEQAMDADRTLGGLAVDVSYDDDDVAIQLEPEVLACIHMTYTLHYRTRVGNPAAAG